MTLTRGRPRVHSAVVRLPISGLLGAGSLLLVASLLPLSPPWSGFSFLVLWFVLLWSGLRICLGLTRETFEFLDFFFHVFFFVWAALSPLAQVSTGSFPWPDHYGETEYARATTLMLIAIGSYEFGRRITRVTTIDGAKQGSALRGPKRTSVPLLAERISRPTRQQLQRSAHFEWFAIGVGFLYVGTIGSVTAFLSTREQLSRALNDSVQGTAVSAFFSGLALGTVYFAVACALVLKWKFKTLALQSGNSIRFALLLLLLILFANPLGHSRFWSGAALGSLLLLWVAIVHPRRIRFLALLALVMLLIAFPYLDRYRDDTQRTARYQPTPTLRDQYLSKLDYDVFQQTLDGVRLTDSRGHSFGEQVSGAVLLIVPRSFWEGKPEPTGVEIGRFANRPSTNLSSPLWIELYIDFGISGVAIVFFTIGSLWRRLGAAVKCLSMYQVILVMFVSLYQIILLRGSLQATSGVLMVVAFSFVWIRSRQEASSDQSGAGVSGDLRDQGSIRQA